MDLFKPINFDEISDREETNSEKYVNRNKLFGSDDVLPMWVADMDIKTPSFIVNAIKDRAKHAIYGYEQATDAMFESQVQWILNHYEWSIQKEWLFMSPSIVASVNVAIRAFSKTGDKIIVQSPVYPKLYSCITNNDRIILDNPLLEKDGFYTMNFDALEESIDDRTSMMILCSPHNPVGRVWTKEELIKLGELCIRHDIIIISDEIHSDLVYQNFQHTPLASLSKALEQRTVTCYGPGKTFNIAGLAISTLCVPSDKLRKQFKKSYDATYFGDGTIFGQIAFESAYSEGELWLAKLLNHLQANIDYFSRCLQNSMPLIKMCKPEGTYLIWLDCRGLGLEQISLQDFFYKEAKLGLSSGVAFGPAGNGFMRINIATPRPILEEATLRLQNAYKARLF